jgi:peptidoglycan/xylan/chitin deacetylase (PgdA/CDA1 family)
MAKLAEMMGVSVVMFEMADVQATEDLLVTVRSHGHRTLAASSETLARLRRQARQGKATAGSLLDGFEGVFVYGFEKAGSEDLTAWLSDRSLCGPTQLGCSAREYSISASVREVCGQLGGMVFPVDGNVRGFVPSHSHPGERTVVGLIGAEERLCFAATRQGGCDIFLLACGGLLDVDADATAEGLSPQHYAKLLPPLMFLRYAFREYCWRNPAPSATLTIDDPLLRSRYGFLAFDQLIAEMEAHRFTGTVAFIPWNYRRSSRHVTDMLCKHRDRFSICVHGCDHVGGEFLSRDEALLRNKARTALRRSRMHENITGLACEPIMIFPQGGFSRAALSALKAEGYLGAVNTTVLPADWRPGDLAIRDLLDVAVTCYDGFPVFGRRYPTSLLPFAFDLFMGKPALIVEHHQYFRDGYTPVCHFVDLMNMLDPQLSWRPLKQILVASALYKRTGQRTAEVRFYTDQFALSNPYNEPMAFRLSKRVGSSESLKYVRSDGLPLEYSVTGDCIEAELELEPAGCAWIELSRLDRSKQPDLNTGFTYQAKVAIRRYLSEFRDNRLARSPRLLRLSKRLARQLPV